MLKNEDKFKERFKALALRPWTAPPPSANPEPPEQQPLEIGQHVPGQGIFAGVWQPKDELGLGKTFNVFAAPQDLTDENSKKCLLNYNDTVKYITKLKGWNGFDGGCYINDGEVYEALRANKYKGEWIIPSKDILKNNLYQNKDVRDLKDSFISVAASGSGFPDWYWSSTEHRDDPSCVWVVRFSDGNEDWNRKDNYRLSCRPVRLVEVPGL